jgi:DNA-binding MarR family transcriptional regulator
MTSTDATATASAPAPELPFGTALALAQRTLSAPLAAVLEQEQLHMPEWFTLNALGLRGTMPIDVMSGLLAGNGLNSPAALDLLAHLESSGLVERHADVVSLTDAGVSRYVQARDRINEVTVRVFEPFGAARVEAARILLQEIAYTDPEELTRRSLYAG